MNPYETPADLPAETAVTTHVLVDLPNDAQSDPTGFLDFVVGCSIFTILFLAVVFLGIILSFL